MEAITYWLTILLSDAPLHHTLVVAWQDKSPVTDKSRMRSYFNCDVIFHAVVGVMNTPSVMSPGFTRPRALCMSMIRMRQCYRCPGLGGLVCACPIQMPS